MSVTREKLYEEIWAEPITKVAKRYDVSDSFLVRVLQRLNVPRPPRGYWAKLAAGKTMPTPVLPEARPEDELEWTRDGQPTQVRRAPPKPPHSPRPPRIRKIADRPAQHALVLGARAHFEDARESDAGYLRDIRSGRGLLVLVYRGEKKAWELPGNGSQVAFDSLVEALQTHWEEISCNHPGVDEIRVIGIDLTMRDSAAE